MWGLKNSQQENVNYMNWMGSTGAMMRIADVENGIRQSGRNYQQQQNVYTSSGNQNIPYFTQNNSNPLGLTGNSSNYFALFPAQGIPPVSSLMPTQEQLQQHTSEIMRNAIMRKQFHNGGKYLK